MRTFDFPTVGIHVVYRKDELFLSPELLRDFEQRYPGRVSDRVLHGMLVIAQNVEAIRAAARAKGDEATFGTWTFNLPTAELDGHVREVLSDSALFRRKLVRLTATSMTWVIEFGRRGGRIHGHYAADGWQDLELIEKAKHAGHGFVGRCNIKRLGAPGYMWKEMGKGAGRRGLGFKLMGAHGDFKGRSVMRDFLIDSPMAECRRLAWRIRFTGEPHSRIWERAKDLYGSWSAGKMNLGDDYDRFRDTIAGGGDAWEDDGGNVEFNIGDFQTR